MEALKKGYYWVMHGESDDPKHRGWMHPLVAGSLTVIISVAILYAISLDINKRYNLVWEISDFARYSAGSFLFAYYIFLIVGRATFMSSTALYDMCWTCNITMLTASLGFFWKNPVIMAASFSTIWVDQMLWYIDVIGFILFRKWPIGVAKYLTWKETPLLKKLTSSHHIWFEPLCMSQLHVSFLLKFRIWDIQQFSLGWR